MNRRLLLGTVCVEAVAAVSVPAYGYLSLVAVVLLYWIDLFCTLVRATVQQFLCRPVTLTQHAAILPPFRLLQYKRGGVTVAERLPPFYLRNLPRVVGVVFVLAISVSTTAYVGATEVPAEFWTDTATPFLVAGGSVAATVKSRIILGEQIASGVHENTPAPEVVPRKRALLFALYAGLLGLVSVWTAGVLGEEGVETARTGFIFFASLLVALRLGYGIHASRTWRNGAATDEQDGGIVARLRSAFTSEQETVTPSPLSVPDEEPAGAITPDRRAVLAAAFVNAMTTGGVVDKRFGYRRAVGLRLLLVLLVPVAVLALIDGAVGVSLALLGVFLSITTLLSAVSAVHMLLALNGLEYRFYESELVAYDRRLGEAQWAVAYSNVRDVSVEQGLFGSPLWLETGTVFVQPFDVGTFDELRIQQTGLAVAFVSDPDRVGAYIRSGGDR